MLGAGRSLQVVHHMISSRATSQRPTVARIVSIGDGDINSTCRTGVRRVGILLRMQPLSTRCCLSRLVGAGSHARAARRVERSTRRNREQGHVRRSSILSTSAALVVVPFGRPLHSRGCISPEVMGGHILLVINRAISNLARRPCRKRAWRNGPDPALTETSCFCALNKHSRRTAVEA
jgi:hypothetical protein